MLNKNFPLIVLLLCFAGCTKSAEKLSVAPAVKVNGEVLDSVEFSKNLAEKMRVYDAAAAKANENLSRAKKEVVRDFILAVIIKKFAAENHITVSDEALNLEFNKVRSSYVSDLAFKESLAQSGLLVEEWRARLKVSLLQKIIIDEIAKSGGIGKQSSSEEVKKYYDSHLREFQHPAETRLSQIVVQHQKEADDLRRFLKSGEYKFEDAAKKFSLSPDGKNGGDIGFLAKGVVPAFDSSMNLPIGQLSPVIKSSYGYHLIKVTAKRPASKTSLEQARADILKLVIEQKKEEAFGKWLEDRVKLTKVEQNTQLIDSLKVYTRGSLE